MGRCTVRAAIDEDVDAICAFGQGFIRAHYTPLIGAEAAQSQVRTWWSEESIRAAITSGGVLIAEMDGGTVAVAHWANPGTDPVVYKLYVAPTHRGHGLGRHMLGAVTAQLPAEAARLWIEHFAANTRAGAFYEREGYVVERVEPDPSDDPRLAVVWRARPLATRARVTRACT